MIALGFHDWIWGHYVIINVRIISRNYRVAGITYEITEY